MDPNHPLAIFVSAQRFPEGFGAATTVGFVQGTVTPIDGQANALNLTVMVNNLNGAPIKLDGAANMTLRLTGSFAHRRRLSRDRRRLPLALGVRQW